MTSMAGSLASTVPVQQVHSCLRHESASAAARALVYQHDGASWAGRIRMVRSLDGTDFAPLDSRSGLTSSSTQLC